MSEFVDAAVRLGGSGNAFKQSTYINANNWDAPDPANRGGALQRGKGLKGGVCLALSAMYLASRGDWSVFKNAINSPGGLAHVRGLMNLQDEATRVWTVSYKTDAGRAFTRDCFKTLGLNYGGREQAEENNQAGAGVTGFVTASGRYLVAFHWFQGGHATAVIKSDGRYQVFDPEHGDAALPDRSAFVAFVNSWIGPMYPGIKRWFVQYYV